MVTVETAHDQPKTHAVITTMNGGEPVAMTAGELHDHTVWGSIKEVVAEGVDAVRDLFKGKDADSAAEGGSNGNPEPEQVEPPAATETETVETPATTEALNQASDPATTSTKATAPVKQQSKPA